jgi:NitT/TauT family transport system substrate-binding protein
MGVSTKAMPNYRGLADLRGKKIGVSAPGSSTNMVANLVLSRAGVKASEVSYVGVGTSAGALAALRSGQIDAMSNTDPVMTMLEQKGDVRIVSDTRTLKGTQEVFGGPMPAACFYTHAEFVRSNPTPARPGQRHRARPEVAADGGPERHHQDRAGKLPARRSRLYLASSTRCARRIALDGLLPEDGAQTALKALAASSLRSSRRGSTCADLHQRLRAPAKDKFKA